MDNFLRLEEYIDGNIPEDEMRDIHSGEEQDVDLVNEIRLRMEVNEAIRDKSLQEFRKLVSNSMNQS